MHVFAVPLFLAVSVLAAASAADRLTVAVSGLRAALSVG
jgi:hypothetical protein